MEDNKRLARNQNSEGQKKIGSSTIGSNSRKSYPSEMDSADPIPPQPPPPPPLPQIGSMEMTLDPSQLPIRKDSTISVSVDDLGPGIIVASYAHSTGLYQGVLLQLNRERGIPCGISFPKNYLVESKTNETPSSSSQENESNPVGLRHTYFQDDKGNLKPLRRIVRATKPPARYKNGKLAMKFRNRPALCSKCKAYCDEKNPPPKQVSVEEVNKQKSTKKSGTAKNGKDSLGNTSSGTENNGKEIGLSETAATSYETVGNIGLVGFYWKRPEDPNKKQAKRAALENNATCSINAYHNRNQKLNSLIDKIKQKVMREEDDDGGVINALESFSISSDSTEKEVISESDKSSPDAITSKTRGKKRSSAVPARFRDEVWTTNVYDAIKRRRQSKTATLNEKTAGSHEGNASSSSVDANGSQLKRIIENVPTNPLEPTKCSNSPKTSPTTPITTKNNQNHSQLEKIDATKNPAIKMKICLGSSSKGNGVFLEIPPAAPAPTPTFEKTSLPSFSPTKDSKRSIRKAKKEAKRKLTCSIAVDSSPIIKPKKALVSPSSPYDPQPPPLTLGPELKIYVAEPFKRKNKIEKQSDKLPILSPIADHNIPELTTIAQSTESVLDYTSTKKKKKLKKKKKDKWVKNIEEIGSESPSCASDSYEPGPPELDELIPYDLVSNTSSPIELGRQDEGLCGRYSPISPPSDSRYIINDEEPSPLNLPKLKIIPTTGAEPLQNSPVPIRMSLKRVDSSNSYSFKSRVNADRLSL